MKITTYKSVYLTGNEDNHLQIRLLIQRFENLNENMFKELLTYMNHSTIKDHVLSMGYLEPGEVTLNYLLLPTILEYQYSHVLSVTLVLTLL